MKHGIFRFAILSLLSFTVCACNLHAARLANSSPKITNPELSEISGIAASLIEPGTFWMINDSGNQSAMFLIDSEGNTVKKVNLSPVNRDWEDLASFQFEGNSWLVVAETGDNRRLQTSYFLYFFHEKVLIASSDTPVDAQATLEFTFEDGPQNCEAIAVDAISGKILFLNKGDSSAALYELDWMPGQSEETVAAKKLTNLELLRNDESAALIKVLTGVNPDAVTAMDIRKDGTAAVVLTYRDVWQFKKPATQHWAQAFMHSPEHLSAHRLNQAEAAAYSLDGTQIVVTSEKLPAPLVTLPATEISPDSIKP